MANGLENLADNISKDTQETAKKAKVVLDKYDYLKLIGNKLYKNYTIQGGNLILKTHNPL